MYKASSTEVWKCRSFLTDTCAHENCPVTISSFFNGVWTQSATTRTAGYISNNSHLMWIAQISTDSRREKPDNLWELLAKALQEQQCWIRPFPPGESCPTDMPSSASDCRDRGRICEKIGMALSQLLPDVLQSLLLYRHRTAKLLGFSFSPWTQESEAAKSIKSALSGWRQELRKVWIYIFSSQKKWHIKTWGLNHHHVVTLLQL